MTNRISHIDIAKGISIALVAMFHSKLKLIVPEIIEPMSLFRLPLFFFLSGVFFSTSINPKLFVIKKSEALLKPYFSVLILVLIYSFYLNQEHLMWQLEGILYGNGDTIKWIPMWFLPHLFAVFCFNYLLFRYVGFDKLPYIMKWACLLVFLTIGISNIDIFWHINIPVISRSVELPGLPFSMDIILITSVFFIAGNILKEKVITFIPNILLLSSSVIVFLCIIFFTTSHINLNDRVYEAPVFATLGAICGIYIIMCVSHSMAGFRTIGNMFIALGGSSLYILIFHSFFGGKTHDLLGEYLTDKSGMFLLSFIAFILSISLPLTIKWAVNNNSYLALFFLPFESNKLLQWMHFTRR